jgi:SAM-dependent methyltransferase
MPNDYSDLNYWNERYKQKFFENEDYVYDWYFPFSQIAGAVSQALKLKNARVIILGCGASDFGLYLYNAGYTNVTNVDFSSFLIEKLKKRYGDLEGLNCKYRCLYMIVYCLQCISITTLPIYDCILPSMYKYNQTVFHSPFLIDVCADVKHLDMFPKNSFDVIFSKGVLDALMSNISCIDYVKSMMSEVHRILAPEGFYYEMTYGNLHARIMYIKQPQFDWTVGQYKIGNNFHPYIIYIILTQC